MVELFESNLKKENRQSSKGNQLKWKGQNNMWYKADYTGYEGLAEYLVSHLLTHSSLKESEFILYETESIQYKHQKYLGCASINFLPAGWKLITLERLFQSRYGKSLTQSIYSIQGVSERIQFVVEFIVRTTGLSNFGTYMSRLLTLDAFFLNEDRHTHNIALLLDNKDKFHYCPIFDNGGSLLSDTTLDYPLGTDVRKIMSEVESKTFCGDFDEQLDIVEQLYGRQLTFGFTKKEVEMFLAQEQYYPGKIKDRVFEILRKQMQKYNYLFCNK